MSAKMSNMTVASLKALLRERGLPLSGKRDALLLRCQQNGLIATNTRRNLLEAELRAVGCELRTDSKLCSAYVAHGEGDPREIAQTMAEMRFYHEHTRYAALRDKIYEDARAEYEAATRRRRLCGFYDREFDRIYFSDYFDAAAASCSAQEAALSEWVSSHGGAEAAIRDFSAVLPATLHRALVHRSRRDRYEAWFKTTFGTDKKLADYATKLADGWITSEVNEANDRTFDAKFGRALRTFAGERAMQIEASDRASEFVQGVGLDPTSCFGQRLRAAAEDMAKKYPTSSKRMLRKAMIAEVRRHLHPGVEMTFARAAEIELGSFVYALSSMRAIRKRLGCVGGKWKCSVRNCKYAGGAVASSLMEHARVVHGVHDPRATQGSLVEGWANVDLRGTFVAMCAGTIQRAWRRAIADPERTMCRRRLIKEFAELPRL